MRAAVVAALGLAAATAGATEPTRAAGHVLEKVRAAVDEHIQTKVKEGGGVYRLTDEKNGDRLELEVKAIAIVGAARLWRIHDPTRRVTADPNDYFACVNFHPIGEPDAKRYDVDFRVAPRDGKLAVVDAVIHREPRLEKGRWTWVARFTLERVEPPPGK